MEEKKPKVVVGLEAQGHIKTIEDYLKKWDDSMLYSIHVWREIGNRIGWCPHMATLDYFRYLSRKKK
jgi:hypothetical protein